MENCVRKPFQGVGNIIRFNWHYYLISALLVVVIFAIQHYFRSFGVIGDVLVLLVLCSTIISLAVSTYIYDFSDLYRFEWLSRVGHGKEESIVNINAGFDETSSLLKSKYKVARLFVADFYDPAKHTEVSIRRARQVYRAYPQTQQISTDHLPIQDNSADIVFAILSAHEIRNTQERIIFFKELNRILKPTGKIIVTEHLRDTNNFLAYNVGFFHFYSKGTWLNTFRLAGLLLSKEIKITPFITSFILTKNGTAS